MGLHLAKVDVSSGRYRLGSHVSAAVTAGGLVIALFLMFLVGMVVGPDISLLQPRVVGIVAVCAGVLVIVQFVGQLFVLTRAGRTERMARTAVRELTDRNDQFQLVSRLSDLLGREYRRRRIIGRAIDFFLEEMASFRAVYWRTDSEGAPVAPTLARSLGDDERAAVPLATPQQQILARSAARRATAVIVDGIGEQPRSLDCARPPQGPFVLFLPLPGGDICEGVLEVHGDGASWPARRSEILATLARQIGGALERGRRYDELERRADADYVTGLYNYGFMQTYLQRLLADASSRGRSVAVIFLDVDDFKAFNDNLGHGAGDRVLQTVADQLKLMTDKVGIVGRSGGDEFMVVLPDHSGSDAEAFIEAFQDWLSLGAPAVNGIYRVNVSGGYAVFPQDAHDRQELLAAADARLYKAKHRAQRLRPHYAGVGDEAEPSLGVYGLLDRILSSIDVRDSYTRLHCEKTAEYAIILAQQLGLSPSAQRTLRLAALLHDVGKVGIPDDILRKPGPLSVEEFEVIKHHISIADHLIVDIPNADEVRKLVRSHHERWDGGGYPQGLKDEEIPYLARILSVADAFSAITLDRPYRRRLPDDEACAELERAAGTQLDPDIVRSFSEALRHLAGESAPQHLATPAA